MHRQKADGMIQEAQIQTNELVSEHEIMQQAYAQANEIVTAATAQAQQILDNATNDANQIRVEPFIIQMISFLRRRVRSDAHWIHIHRSMTVL